MHRELAHTLRQYGIALYILICTYIGVCKLSYMLTFEGFTQDLFWRGFCAWFNNFQYLNYFYFNLIVSASLSFSFSISVSLLI